MDSDATGRKETTDMSASESSYADKNGSDKEKSGTKSDNSELGKAVESEEEHVGLPSKEVEISKLPSTVLSVTPMKDAESEMILDDTSSVVTSGSVQCAVDPKLNDLVQHSILDKPVQPAVEPTQDTGDCVPCEETQYVEGPEKLTEGSKDVNNISNETFCSNISSPRGREEVQEPEVIVDSDNEERLKDPSKSPGSSGGFSQASTIDIADIGIYKVPQSPSDLFESQVPDVPICQNSESTYTLEEDVIPSSQSVESDAVNVPIKSVEEMAHGAVDSLLLRKRKLQDSESDSELDHKVARIDNSPLVSQDTKTSESDPNCMKEVKLQEQEHVKSDGNSESLSLNPPMEISTSEKEQSEIEVSKVDSNDVVVKAQKEIVSGVSECVENAAEEDNCIAQEKAKSRCSNGEDHKVQSIKPSSVEVEFMTIDTQLPEIDPRREEENTNVEQVLPAAYEEEECSEDSQEEDLHLHLSVSGNTLDCSQGEKTEVKGKTDTQPSDLSGKRPSEKISENLCSSHNTSHCRKTNVTLNSHGEVKAAEEGIEAFAVEDSGLHVSSGEKNKEKATDMPLRPASTSCDVIFLEDDSSEDISKRSTNLSLKKNIVISNSSTPVSDNVSVFTKGKEGASKIPDNALSTQTQDNGLKRKREIMERQDIHRSVSDSESEEHPGPQIRKRSRDENHTPDQAICSKQVKDNSPEFNGNRPAVELEKRMYLECRIKVKCIEQTQEIVSWEVAQWEDITDDLVPGCAQNQVMSDLSLGVLGDESSKHTSPGSVASTEPYPLQPRILQRISMSSSSSGGTSVGFSASRFGGILDSGHFLAPSKPAARPFKEKSFLSENLQGKPFIASGHRYFLKDSELVEKVERRIQQDCNYDADKEAYASPRHKTAPLESERQTVVLKSKSAPTLPLDFKNEMESSSKIDKKEPSTNEIKSEKSIESTPKSTKKSHARSARTTRNASKGTSNAAKALREMKDFMEGEQAKGKDIEGSDMTISLRKPRRTPMKANKKSDTALDEVKPVSAPSTRSRRGRIDKIDVETPKTPETGQVMSNWSIESCISKLVPDAPAFARWTDKRYYSAKIKEKAKDDRWVVEFDDGNVKMLKEEFIIPVNILTKGQVVFASVEDEYGEGIITKFKVEDDEVQYGIEMDDGDIVYVPRSKLFMTEDQAKILQEDVVPKPTPVTPKSTSVSVDNIVQGKRSRSNRMLRTMESPGISGIARLTPKCPNKTDTIHDVSCSSSMSDATDKGSTSALEEVAGVDPEVRTAPEAFHALKTRGKGPGRIKGKGRSTLRKSSSSNHSIGEAENPEFVESLGPIPPKGSKIFSGMHFLMTFAGAKILSKKSETYTQSHHSDTETECATGTDDCEDRVFSKHLFVRDHLKRQLEAGGGTVYEDFEDVPTNLYSSCYLIADRPTLTAKYILCLAYGIRIILHDWVIHKTKGLDTQLMSCRLQAGWSLERKCFIEDESRSKKRKPLNKKEVGLVHESKRFISFWDQVLVALGAKVMTISPEEDKDFSKIHVIVSDSSCPPEIQDRAREWDIPLVSTVWVKQCLIMWEARPYNGHPHYRYDYCSSD